MTKAIVPINQADITEDKFNEYDLYYRLNEDYIWCICWNEYLDKKETYIDWCIEITIAELQSQLKPQRELLIAFFMHFRNNGEQKIGMTIEEFVDDFLAIKCG